MRTEQEVLKDFAALGYKLEEFTDCMKRRTLRLYIKIPNYYEDGEQLDKEINILLDKLTYECCNYFYGVPAELTMEEHKLLNELFTIYGWI